MSADLGNLAVFDNNESIACVQGRETVRNHDRSPAVGHPVERRLDRLTTMVEPLMMMTMGLLIGGIVVAMYIPIFQMAGTVQ